jgi:hypothetical protein
VQEAIWAETFKYMADNNVMFEGILLKPAMVTPGADSSAKVPPETVAAYTLKMLRRRVPPAGELLLLLLVASSMHPLLSLLSVVMPWPCRGGQGSTVGCPSLGSNYKTACSAFRSCREDVLLASGSRGSHTAIAQG